MFSGVLSSLAVAIPRIFQSRRLNCIAEWVWLIIAKTSSQLNCKLRAKTIVKSLQNSQAFALADHTVSYQGPLGCQKRLHHLVASSWKRSDLSRSVHPRNSQTNLVCDTARLGTWTRIFSLLAFNKFVHIHVRQYTPTWDETTRLRASSHVIGNRTNVNGLRWAVFNQDDSSWDLDQNYIRVATSDHE